MKNGFYYFKTADGLSIRFRIARNSDLAVSGSVICLTGRSEFIEKYSETIDELVERGFHVYSLDWRGQGLSGRILENRHKGHVNTFDEYVGDLEEFMEKIVFPSAPAPLIMLAHSMGGHIALRYLHRCHKFIDRAVLLSPMININFYPMPAFLMRFLVRVAVKAGFGEAYSAGSGDYVPGGRKFENNRLTSDPDRFFDTYIKIEQNRDLALGGSTYGWLYAASESIDVLKTRGYVERITTPTLIVSSVNESVVSRHAQKKIYCRMPQCTIIDIEGARHEILRERDHFRKQFWDVFDAFVLQKHENNKQENKKTGAIMEKNHNVNYDYEDETPPSLLSGHGGWWSNVSKKHVILGGAGALIVILLLIVIFARGGSRTDERQVQLPSYDVMERMQGRFERLESRIDDIEMQLTRLPALIHQVETMGAGGDTGKLEQISARIDSIDNRIRELGEENEQLKSRQQQISKEISETRAVEQPAPEAVETGEARYHEVQKGDTLFSIARNNNIPLQTLLEQNNLTEDSIIKPGDRLILKR